MTLKNVCFTLLLTMCVFMVSGCDLVEGLVTDVGGWDMSACIDGFSTCWELFSDNSDKFEDGFVEAMSGL